MPSTRTSAIIGLGTIFCILLILEPFVNILESFAPGLTILVTVLLIALAPVIAASALLDRRAAEPPAEPPPERHLPRGIRSASGETVARPRPKPRVRRGRRAAQLETIVLSPQGRPTTATRGTRVARTTEGAEPGATTSARLLRPRRTRPTEVVPEEKEELEVEQELEALEREMARLEEELSAETENSTGLEPLHSEVSSEEATTPPSDSPTRSAHKVSREDASSELQAIEELLERLEKKRSTGGISETTYERLRSKYLQRKAELSGHV